MTHCSWPRPDRSRRIGLHFSWLHGGGLFSNNRGYQFCMGTAKIIGKFLDEESEDFETSLSPHHFAGIRTGSVSSPKRKKTLNKCIYIWFRLMLLVTPFWRICSEISQNLQESSKVASNISCARRPEMKHLVPVCLSIPFRLSSIKRMLSSVSATRKYCAWTLYCVWKFLFSFNVINSKALITMNKLKSRTT